MFKKSGLFLFLLTALQVSARYKNVLPEFTKDVIELELEELSSSLQVASELAQPGQLPHHASIRTVSSVGAVGSCGGAVVSRRWVLTAAQCTAGRVNLIIRTGVVSLSDNNPENIFETTEWYNFPTFDDLRPTPVQPNDITLVRLQRLVVYSRLVQPIRVQSSADSYRNYDGEQVYISGHGSTSTSVSDELRWVYLKAISNNDCAWSFASGVVLNTIVCAESFNVTSQSACQGDFGGPLVHVGSDGVPTLIGLFVFTTSEYNDCPPGLPTGYTRPGPYLPWFQQITGLNFENLKEEDDEEVEDTTTTSTSTTTTTTPYTSTTTPSISTTTTTTLPTSATTPSTATTTTTASSTSTTTPSTSTTTTTTPSTSTTTTTTPTTSTSTTSTSTIAPSTSTTTTTSSSVSTTTTTTPPTSTTTTTTPFTSTTTPSISSTTTTTPFTSTTTTTTLTTSASTTSTSTTTPSTSTTTPSISTTTTTIPSTPSTSTITPSTATTTPSTSTTTTPIPSTSTTTTTTPSTSTSTTTTPSTTTTTTTKPFTSTTTPSTLTTTTTTPSTSTTTLTTSTETPSTSSTTTTTEFAPDESTTAPPNDSEEQEPDEEDSDSSECNEDDDKAQLLKRLEVNVKVKVEFSKYNVLKALGMGVNHYKH